MGYQTTFNTTPQPTSATNSYGTLTGIFPKQSNTLSGLSLPTQTQLNQTNIPGNTSYTQPTGMNVNNQNQYSIPTGTNSGVLPTHGTPTGKVSSLTTGTDGTTKTTYDNTGNSGSTGSSTGSSTSTSTPTPLAPDDPQNQYNTATGQPNPNWVGAKSSQTSPGTNGNNGTNFQQNLGNVQNTGNQTSNENTTLTGLIGQSQQPSQAYTQGMANYDTANQKLADYNSQLAQTDKNISAQGISLDSARGQIANVGQAATAEEAALQGGVTNASNILGAANTQQGLQVQAGTAANSAAQTTAQRNLAAQEGVLGAVAPVSQFGVLTNPATGNPVNGQSATTDAINGGTIQGLQGAAQSNAQVSGTATTNVANTGLQSSINNYVAANTAYSTATQQSQNLQATMASTGINTNPQFANQAINTLQNQLGSAKYTSFITALSEAQQAYTSLLSSVGAATPTVNGQQATAIFNPNSTPAQINAAITALNQAAYAKLQPLYDQIGTYASQLGGGSSTTNSTPANGRAF